MLSELDLDLLMRNSLAEAERCKVSVAVAMVDNHDRLLKLRCLGTCSPFFSTLAYDRAFRLFQHLAVDPKDTVVEGPLATEKRKNAPLPSGTAAVWVNGALVAAIGVFGGGFELDRQVAIAGVRNGRTERRESALPCRSDVLAHGYHESQPMLIAEPASAEIPRSAYT